MHAWQYASTKYLEGLQYQQIFRIYNWSAWGNHFLRVIKQLNRKGISDKYFQSPDSNKISMHREFKSLYPTDKSFNVFDFNFFVDNVYASKSSYLPLIQSAVRTKDFRLNMWWIGSVPTMKKFLQSTLSLVTYLASRKVWDLIHYHK